ncbi:MAG: hydrolase, family [Caulobacteraceae bacterium]|nr:hydrolase, family [Caulobacteraceae bacterium]
MTRKLAVWDVDGTLVDSREVIFEAAKAVFAFMDLPAPDYEAVRQIVGLSLAEGLGQLLPAMSPPAIDRAVAGYKEAFQAMHRQPGFTEPLYEGAAQTLDRLKRDGWLIAMATGKSRRGVETIMKMHGWADLFDSTHCADDGPGKPHPAMLLEAMRALGCGPDQTIMIGDTAHDMRMAKAAGVYAQGVSWGFHTAEEVLAAGADDVVHDFPSLDSRLEAFAETISSAA